MPRKTNYPNKPTMMRGGKAWFYESRYGVCVVAQKFDRDGVNHGCTVTDISWAKLGKAVDNHRKVLRAKSRRRR